LKLRETLAKKFTTNFLTIFTVSIALLMTVAIAIFGQNTKISVAVRQVEAREKAEKIFKEALASFEAKDKIHGRVQLRQAMDLWLEMREPEKAAQYSLQVGDDYSRDHKFLESLFYYKQVSNIKQLSAGTRATAFYSIAKVYAELYHKELALRYFSKALVQAQEAKSSSKQAEILIGLATFYYQIGEKQQAASYLEKIRHLNLQLSGGMLADILFLSGQIGQGQLHKAHETLENALVIYQETGNKEGELKVRCALADCHRSSGQNRLAIEEAQQADRAAKLLAEATSSDAGRVRLRKLRWTTALALARAQLAVGQQEDARKSYLQVISAIEGIWISLTIATDAGAIAFGEQRQIPYRELVNLLIEQRKLDEAYNRMEQSKSRTTLGLIEARHRADVQKPASQIGTLHDLAQKIASKRTRLFSASLTSKERAKIERELEEAELAREEAKANAEMEETTLKWARALELGKIQEKLKQNENCVLEFFLGEPHSYAWIISSDNLDFITLPGRKEIENKVEEYLKLITEKPNKLRLDQDITKQRDQAGKLADFLLGDAIKQITDHKKLLIVPDGILYYLPFEALIHKGKYLLEDYEISYMPAASMLGSEPDLKSSSTEQGKMELLAFGDSVFRQESNASATRGRQQIKPALRAFQDFRLSALPRTRDEVDEIANLFHQDQRKVYLGAASTEEAFKAEPLRRYKRIHIASHSLVDQEHPSRSAVLFSLDKDPSEDGFLEVSEIADLDLDCDLVVLSACQTGQGQLVAGEGVIGLSRAFFHAGARSVVVSLWNVSDSSTSQFMKSFYKNLFNGAGNAAALREAKLEMMKGGKERQHPYHWAPFVLVGRP
jgi:CHAT domain-containing protein/tetratricopeptide (TPR) repeat protein